MPREGLTTTDGQKIEILSVGIHNRDAGPDFFGADVIIGDEDWMGNVEIHTRSSDWYRHGHDKDEAYNNVVLHVAETVDTDVVTATGRKVPQLVLSVPEYVVENYQQLQAVEDYPPCYGIVADLPRLITKSWLEYLADERLQGKVSEIERRLAFCEFDWERVLFITMASAFGFGTNSGVFEEWARQIPYSGAAKHRDNLFQIEAMFLGVAGLLDEAVLSEAQKQRAPTDVYYQRLVGEYRFLANKFSLKSIGGYRWKFMRLRPQNFPTLRLARFAALYCGMNLRLSSLVDAADVGEVRKLLSGGVSDYWQHHYILCSPEVEESVGCKMQKKSLDLLIINGVVPVLYAYGRYRGSKKLIEKALAWLEALEPEDNKYIRLWRQMGLVVSNARESQAVLQQTNHYCNRRDCLRCRLGYCYIKQKKM